MCGPFYGCEKAPSAIAAGTPCACLGNARADSFDTVPHRTTFVSIGIGDVRHRGHGYGRDAMHVGLNFVFNELNLYRVCLTVFSYNESAIALYEALGFTREGVYREHLERDGRRYDMYLYGLLRPEWEKSQHK